MTGWYETRASHPLVIHLALSMDSSSFTGPSGLPGLARCVETLNLLGDESRLRLCALLRGRELRVTDLVRVTGIAQSRVSTHLGRLRDAGFVRDRRDGSQSFYALAWKALPVTAQAVLTDATSSGDPTLKGDQQRLEALDAERRGSLPESFVGEMDRRYSPGRTWESLASGVAALLELGDVLDVGCGDGAASRSLAPYCRSLVGVDRSAKMVVAARERLLAFPHARVEEADAHALPFEDARFDAVVVFHTLTYAEHPGRVVDECARVLRPGGRLVVLSLDAHEHRALTAPYGERHPGFSPRALRGFVVRAGLDVVRCDIACREVKKPHFQVVLALGRKPGRRAPARDGAHLRAERSTSSPSAAPRARRPRGASANSAKSTKKPDV